MGAIKDLNKVLKNIALGRGKQIATKIISYADDAAAYNFNRVRKFSAFDLKGKFLGSLTASFHKGERVFVKDVNIGEHFQGKGVGSQLFNYAARFSQLAKKRFMWTSTAIASPHMLDIRGKFPTKNIAQGLGKFGENSALVSNNAAKSIAERRNTMASIKSVSDLKGVKFIRKHGRIIPIRIKI